MALLVVRLIALIAGLACSPCPEQPGTLHYAELAFDELVDGESASFNLDLPAQSATYRSDCDAPHIWETEQYLLAVHSERHWEIFDLEAEAGVFAIKSGNPCRLEVASATTLTVTPDGVEFLIEQNECNLELHLTVP